MLTDAGNRSGESSSMNGTKELAHMPMKVKISTTAIPGHISGRTMLRSAGMLPAPSTQAASSSEIGTPSMNVLVSQIANGNAVVAMNIIVPPTVSTKLSCTNSPYTGTITAVIGRPVANSTVSRNGRLNLVLNRDSG